jgi:anaphase-promoting complex subunit 8
MPHAAHYFRRILELRGGERVGDGAPEVQEALSFLANFCKERGELREASQYCTRLVDSGSQFKEEAKAMLREIHARTTSG